MCVQPLDMDAWLTKELGVPIVRSYLAVEPRHHETQVRVVILDVDSACVSSDAATCDKDGVSLALWSLEDAVRRYRPSPGAVCVPAEPYITPEIEDALSAAMAPEHIRPLFDAHSNIEYVMSARCGDGGTEPAVLVGVTAKGYVPVGEDQLPTSIGGVRVCVLDGRASLCGKTTTKTLRRGQDISGGAKLEDGFGTLGGLVRRKSDRRVYLVTAAHVLTHVECKVEATKPMAVTKPECRCITDSLAALQWRHLLAVKVSMYVAEALRKTCCDWGAWQTAFLRYWKPDSQPSANPILRRLMNGDASDVREVALINEYYHCLDIKDPWTANAAFLDVAFLKPTLAHWNWDVQCSMEETFRDGFVTRDTLNHVLATKKRGVCRAVLVGAVSGRVEGTVQAGSSMHIYVQHESLKAREQTPQPATADDVLPNDVRLVKMVPRHGFMVRQGDSGAMVYVAVEEELGPSGVPRKTTWQCLGILCVRTVDGAQVVGGVCPTWSWPEEWRDVVHKPDADAGVNTTGTCESTSVGAGAGAGAGTGAGGK